MQDWLPWSQVTTTHLCCTNCKKKPFGLTEFYVFNWTGGPIKQPDRLKHWFTGLLVRSCLISNNYDCLSLPHCSMSIQAAVWLEYIELTYPEKEKKELNKFAIKEAQYCLISYHLHSKIFLFCVFYKDYSPFIFMDSSIDKNFHSQIYLQVLVGKENRSILKVLWIWFGLVKRPNW